MTSPNAYIHFDELDRLPQPNRQNYLFELDFLTTRLSSGTSVLQVGSMDGIRILRFLERRPDLVFTGLEIEENLVAQAEENVRKARQHARFITADITRPPANLEKYNYVVCLNNTLGYIPDYGAALRHMRKLGTTYISVFGEEFDDSLAKEYYAAVDVQVDDIIGDELVLRGIGRVRRFPHATVESWGNNIVKTPLGYLVEVS